MRHTLGTFERTQLVQAVNAYESARYTQSIGNLVGGIGVLGIGGGLLMASFVLGAWQAPQVVGKVKNVVTKAKEKVIEVVASPGGTLDDVVDASSGGLISMRRRAQALARRRGEVSDSINFYCTVSSKGYDVQKCNTSHDEKDAYFAARSAFAQEVESFVAGRDQPATARRFIYGGLGDIDPLY